jgi:hypothetical protein
MRTLSDADRVNPASSYRRLAFAESPELFSAAVISLVPTMPPRTAAAMTKTIQPKIAVFRCRALHRPMRAAMFNELLLLRGVLRGEQR